MFFFFSSFPLRSATSHRFCTAPSTPRAVQFGFYPQWATSPTPPGVEKVGFCPPCQRRASAMWSTRPLEGDMCSQEAQVAHDAHFADYQIGRGVAGKGVRFDYWKKILGCRSQRLKPDLVGSLKTRQCVVCTARVLDVKHVNISNIFFIFKKKRRFYAFPVRF